MARTYDPDTHRPIALELTPLNVAVNLAYALCQNGRACVYGTATIHRDGYFLPVCLSCGVPARRPRWSTVA